MENATRTRPFVVAFVENWVSPQGEHVHEFVHVLQDWFSHNEVWPQQCDHLYVSLLSGLSVGKNPDIDVDAEPAVPLETEPAVKPEELKPLPTDEASTEDSHEPAASLDDAGNEIPDQSTDPDDLPEVDMDRPLLVTFGNELPMSRP